ncbi:MAG: alpha-1,3-galactosidase B, partial [Paramuribaculum sp.]|nr:alpha-1,3-galactosidase B [Paramuribaculum sp.]
MSDFGIKPGAKTDCTVKMARALEIIAEQTGKHDVILNFESGTYNFYPEKAVKRNYYISNHDQSDFKKVGIDISGWKNLTINGNNAKLIFHGRMLPVAIVNSTNCTLTGMSIDFEDTQICQVTVVSNNTEGLTFKVDGNCRGYVNKQGRFIVKGYDWEVAPGSAIAFEPDSRRMVYRSSDVWAPLDSVITLSGGLY